MNIDKKINVLLEDPLYFRDFGDIGGLLNAFLMHDDVTSLITVLKSDDLEAKKIGVWVASELGARVHQLVPEIEKIFLCVDDYYIRYHCLEVFGVCSYGQHSGCFSHVLKVLSGSHCGFKVLAARLIRNTSTSMLVDKVGCSQIATSEKAEIVKIMNHPEYVYDKLIEAGSETLVSGFYVAYLSKRVKENLDVLNSFPEKRSWVAEVIDESMEML